MSLTLVFTDMEGSTAHWERLGDAFQPCLERHNRILREELAHFQGSEVGTGGDSFLVAFPLADDAVAFAVAVQRRLAAEPWPPAIGPVRVRIGMHTGDPIRVSDARGHVDYVGSDVNRAARISAIGSGGQILLSGATRRALQGFEALGSPYAAESRRLMERVR